MQGVGWCNAQPIYSTVLYILFISYLIDTLYGAVIQLNGKPKLVILRNFIRELFCFCLLKSLSTTKLEPKSAGRYTPKA